MTSLGWLVLVSEIVAVLTIVWAWPLSRNIYLRCALIVVAAIPVLGPIVLIWLHYLPDPQHPAYQDRAVFTADVFDRWRHILEETDPAKRMAKFRDWTVPDRKMRRQLKKGRTEK